MTQLQSFLGRLASRLEAAGIEWMITGSTASAIYGEPRPTRDLDVVIVANAEQLDRFVAATRTDGDLSAEAAHEAFREKTMFNIIDLETGWKADPFFRQERPFDIAEFERRTGAKVFGVRCSLISPKGLILRELCGAGESKSCRLAASCAAEA